MDDSCLLLHVHTSKTGIPGPLLSHDSLLFINNPFQQPRTSDYFSQELVTPKMNQSKKNRSET